MDPVRKQRRNGILIVIAVLVAVCAWWVLFVPRTRQYRVTSVNPSSRKYCNRSSHLLEQMR